jgi:hypothetical protein
MPRGRLMKLRVHRVIHHCVRELPSERLGVPKPNMTVAPAEAQIRVAHAALAVKMFMRVFLLEEIETQQRLLALLLPVWPLGLLASSLCCIVDLLL